MNYNNFIRENIQFRIDSLKEYFNFVETNIQNELNEIQKKYEIAKIKYDKLIENSGEDDPMMDYYDDLNYSHSRIQDNILLKHRNAIIFLIYSLVEIELEAFAKHNQFQTSVFTINDLKGNSTFEKFKTYISKTSPVFYKSIEEEIEFLNNVRIVRNIVTHHSNTIRDNHSDYRKVVKFSDNNFEVKLLGSVFNSNIKAYTINFTNKQFVDLIFETMGILFDKMYLEN